MKKSFGVKTGDKVIYITGYTVKESVVVDKPIDNGERPLFKIGRIDLENGEYLINGTLIYDTVKEASEEVIKKIDKELDEMEEKVKLYGTLKVVLGKIKSELLNKIKDKDVV